MERGSDANARRKFSIAAQDFCFKRRCDESSAGGRWMALTAQHAQTRVHRCLALFRFTREIPQQDRGRVIDIEHDALRGVAAYLDHDRPLKSAQLTVPLKSCGKVRSAQLYASTEETKRGEPESPTRCLGGQPIANKRCHARFRNSATFRPLSAIGQNLNGMPQASLQYKPSLRAPLFAGCNPLHGGD